VISQVFYLNSDKFPAIANDYQQVKTSVDKSSHANINTTMIYAHPVKEVMLKAVKALNDY